MLIFPIFLSHLQFSEYSSAHIELTAQAGKLLNDAVQSVHMNGLHVCRQHFQFFK